MFLCDYAFDFNNDENDIKSLNLFGDYYETKGIYYNIIILIV